MHPQVAANIPVFEFSLFLGTALSITALPILGRIMMELNITRTRLGTITISTAAVDDALGWILLAATAAIVRAEFRLFDSLRLTASTIAFGAFMILVARPLLCRWIRSALRRHEGVLTVNNLAVLLMVLFSCAMATNLIGIFAIFGAFILGAVLSTEEQFRLAVNHRLRDLVTAFFLPIFFAYTGLRTDVGTLGSMALWSFCFLLTLAAIVGKLGGCGLAAWVSGFSLRESVCIGTLMNTRALMALIVINVGKDLGVIPDSVFCMLILMALVTTFMTTPLLLRLVSGTELEPHIRQSGFLSCLPTTVRRDKVQLRARPRISSRFSDASQKRLCRQRFCEASLTEVNIGRLLSQPKRSRARDLAVCGLARRRFLPWIRQARSSDIPASRGVPCSRPGQSAFSAWA